MDRRLATFDVPLLNRAEPYISDSGRTEEDDVALYYDAAAGLRRRTHLSNRDLNLIYRDAMRFFTETERLSFRQYQAGEKKPEEFERDCAMYLKRSFPQEMGNDNDFGVMMERIMLAMFGYDVIQPLIDNEDTSDIKICGPYDIRVRVKGKAYKSNATFMDEGDLFRFVDGLAIRNQVNIFEHPLVTFTDKHDANYILRFMVSSPVVNSVDYPYLHITHLR